MFRRDNPNVDWDRVKLRVLFSGAAAEFITPLSDEGFDDEGI